MKRDNLVELIMSYPEDTEFFVEGWGGRPGQEIYATLVVDGTWVDSPPCYLSECHPTAEACRNAIKVEE